MSRAFKLLVAFSLFVITATNAQNKVLTIDEAFKNRSIYPKYLEQLNWMGKSENYVFVANDNLVKGYVNKDKRDTVLRFGDLNKSFGLTGGDALQYFPDITWMNEKTFRFTVDNVIYTYDMAAKKVSKANNYDKEAENMDIEPNNLYVAYTIKNNLFIAAGNKQLQITADADENIVNGKSVHRDEFGIVKGTFWSPKGNLLAFYRMDQTMVTDYPLVDIDKRIAEETPIKYPMAGMKSHHVTVGVYNPKTQSKIFLKTGEPAEQYLTNITWSLDEKYIFIAVLNRDQNHLKLNQYDAATGDFVKTLFEETNIKYIEPLHGLYILKTKPDNFLWFSYRDGYYHIYMYDLSGKMIKQVTKGDYDVTDLIGFDEKDAKLFYISTEANPLERNIYCIDLATGNKTKISGLAGTHEALLSGNGKYVIDNLSSISVANASFIESADGKTVQTLIKDENPLKNFKNGKTTIFSIKANDNKTDLYCRLIKPYNFDSTKKYPVIVYVYGGPHAQMITNTWLAGAGIFLNHMANKGYLVFTLDNRGSGGRGLAFEQAIYRNVGKVELDDQMKGIEYLRKLSYVDTSRIGVHGWSYGGFMTINMLLKQPDVFKVAVAGGPVIDWKYYEVMYGERYMDTPEQNPDGYKNSSLLNYVDSLKGHLLIIHGTNDPTVVWQHSLLFVKKCVDEGKQLDYFVYPGHEHNVSGKDRLHMYKKIERYFDDYLK